MNYLLFITKIRKAYGELCRSLPTVDYSPDGWNTRVNKYIDGVGCRGLVTFMFGRSGYFAIKRNIFCSK